MSAEVDYGAIPSEDFARATVKYVDEDGLPLIVEATTSWSFVGAGLRLTMELMGPEYSMSSSTLDNGTKVFLSRRLRGLVGEDLVEKQNAEQGLMPLVGNEYAEYGYEAENRALRHRVRQRRAARARLPCRARRDRAADDLLHECGAGAGDSVEARGTGAVRAAGGPGAGGAALAASTTPSSGWRGPADLAGRRGVHEHG